MACPTVSRRVVGTFCVKCRLRLAVIAGPPIALAALTPAPAVRPLTPTTINVAIAQAVTAPIALRRILSVGDKAPATVPATAAEKMPDATHQAKPIQAGIVAPEEVSKLTSPMPRPNIVSRACTISEAITPLMTADHVQPAVWIEVRAMALSCLRPA